jgi:hypothetical protein
MAGDEHEHDGSGGFLDGGCLGARFGIGGLSVAARRLELDQKSRSAIRALSQSHPNVAAAMAAKSATRVRLGIILRPSAIE